MPNEIVIEKSQVLKYLGKPVGNYNKDIDVAIDNAIAKVSEIITLKHVLRYYDVIDVLGGILVGDTTLILQGNAIKKHLAGCEMVALFCATASAKIDDVIAFSHLDVLNELLLDTAASVAIETYCDNLSDKIEQNASRENLYVTNRFSPGYGDLSLDIQGEFLSILDAPKRIGVFASASGLLTPKKSVTALIGISKTPVKKVYDVCNSCLKRNDCELKNRGEHCGK